MRRFKSHSQLTFRTQQRHRWRPETLGGRGHGTLCWPEPRPGLCVATASCARPAAPLPVPDPDGGPRPLWRGRERETEGETERGLLSTARTGGPVSGRSPEMVKLKCKFGWGKQTKGRARGEMSGGQPHLPALPPPCGHPGAPGEWPPPGAGRTWSRSLASYGPRARPAAGEGRRGRSDGPPGSCSPWGPGPWRPARMQAWAVPELGGAPLPARSPLAGCQSCLQGGHTSGLAGGSPGGCVQAGTLPRPAPQEGGE